MLQEVFIQTSFLRSLLKSTNCSHCDIQEIYLPFANCQHLELMVQFLYTGEIISDSIEASKEVLRILVDVLKFPSECDVTRYIECPMWDCGEHVDSLGNFLFAQLIS